MLGGQTNNEKQIPNSLNFPEKMEGFNFLKKPNNILERLEC